MKKLKSVLGIHVSLSLFICLISSVSFSQENYSRVKIYGTDAEINAAGELGVTVDHGQHKHNTWFMTDLSETEIQILIDNGFTFEIIIEDVKAHYVAQNLDPALKTGEKTTTCPTAADTRSFGLKKTSRPVAPIGNAEGRPRFAETRFEVLQLDGVAVCLLELLVCHTGLFARFVPCGIFGEVIGEHKRVIATAKLQIFKTPSLNLSLIYAAPFQQLLSVSTKQFSWTVATLKVAVKATVAPGIFVENNSGTTPSVGFMTTMMTTNSIKADPTVRGPAFFAWND